MKNSNGDNFTENLMSETDLAVNEWAHAQGGCGRGAEDFSVASVPGTRRQKESSSGADGFSSRIRSRRCSAPSRRAGDWLGDSLLLGEEPQLTLKRALRAIDWSTISPAFLPGLMRSVKRGYADSAQAVKGGLERVKEVDVDDYVKPLRKRWTKWMS
jgi:hypothetical protein